MFIGVQGSYSLTHTESRSIISVVYLFIVFVYCVVYCVVTTAWIRIAFITLCQLWTLPMRFYIYGIFFLQIIRV